MGTMTEAEFTEIVESTKRVVLSAIEKNLYPRFLHAIDDVVQETYLRAYKSLQKKQFEGRSALTTWLYTIARNESIRMNEKLGREDKKIAKLQAEPEREPAPRSDNNSEDMMGWVKRLPARYMQVIKMYLGGSSEKEIADRLEISPGTVKSRAHRAREMMRKMMEKEGQHAVK